MFSEVVRFIKQAEDFLAQYHQFLTFRIAGLEQGARGDSRFLSLWLAEITRRNVLNALDKTDEPRTRLETDASLTWYARLFSVVLPHTVVEKLGWTPDVRHQILAQHYKVKAIQYLLSAEEVLSEQVNISELSNQTIPVQEHAQQYRQAKACLDQLNRLKINFPQYFENIQQQKTWLSKDLHLGRALVALRVAAFGLSKNRHIKGSDTQPSALTEEDIMTTLDNILNQELNTEKKVSKTTRKTLEISDFSEEPVSAIHRSHFPKQNDILIAFDKLKALMPRDKGQPNPEFRQVLDALAVPFPKPSRP